MKTKDIYLRNVADITAFVLAASEVEGDVIANKGSIAVDGKSFLGMVHILSNEKFTISYPEEANYFDSYLDTLTKN